jgi:hypothetical protein
VSRVVFGQKFPGEKGNMIYFIVVMQQPVLVSPELTAKSSHSHHKMPQGYKELTVWPAKTNSLWAIPLMSKKMISMLFSYLTFLGLPWTKHPCTAHAFILKHLSHHCQGLCRTSSEICATQNGIRPDTWLQVKRQKASAHPPICVKFCTLTSKMC